MKAKAIVTGRLGKDAETKTFESNGNSVVAFSLASNVHYRDAKRMKLQKTDWHDVRIFVKELNSSFVNLLTKGAEVTVFGNIAYNEYQDQNRSNQKRMYIDARTSDISISGGSIASQEEDSK